jgi:hypothetical protein
MSETDATEALLARLSYQASVRAGEVARRAASKFPIQKVAKISLMFCILVSYKYLENYCSASSFICAHIYIQRWN